MRFSPSIVAIALFSASQAFGQTPTWNNSAADNNFANSANWTGWPGSFNPGTNQDWRINLSGANRAELNSAIGNVRRDISVGRGAGLGELFIGGGGSLTATRDVLAGSINSSGKGLITVQGGTLNTAGELSIGDNGAEGTFNLNGGTVAVGTNMRQGRAGGTDGFGIVNVGTGGTGGTLSANNFMIGQSNRAENVFTLHSGTVTATTTLNVAHQAGNRGHLVINGGAFSAGNAVFSDSGNAASPSIASLTVTGGSLTTTTDGLTFASSAGGNTATVNLSGIGVITSATSMAFGFGDNSTASLNMTGGTLNATTSFMTFGQGANSNTAVTISGGTINADRLNFGNNATAAASLNMSGGTINVTAHSASTAGNRGALVMGSATPDLDLSGLSLISAERLNNNDGGSIDLGGSAILRLKGSTIEASLGVKANTAPTFSMTAAQVGAATWASILGTINLSSMNSRLEAIGVGEVVDGALITDPDFNVNFVSLFNDAISNNKITHNVAGGMFDVGYDGTYSYVRVVPVPEPSSLAMVGLLSFIAAGRRFRRR